MIAQLAALGHLKGKSVEVEKIRYFLPDTIKEIKYNNKISIMATLYNFWE